MKDSRLSLLWLEVPLALALLSSAPAAMSADHGSTGDLATPVMSLREPGGSDSGYRDADPERLEGQAGLIQQVQIELTSRGYEPGEADGYAGAGTRAAVRAYQRDAGLAINGKIDSALLAQLERRAFVGRPFFSMATGTSPSLIGNAQLALARAGYYRGPVDGLLNPATRAAIRNYRTKPYEQFYVDGFPRDYPYLSPAEPSELPDVPSVSIASDWIGIDAWYAGAYEQAITETTAIIRAHDADAPMRSRAFFVRGLAYLSLGGYAAAARDFTSVLRLVPDNSDAYLNRAIAYERAGLLELARRDYRRAVDLGISAIAASPLVNLP